MENKLETTITTLYRVEGLGCMAYGFRVQGSFSLGPFSTRQS